MPILFGKDRTSRSYFNINILNKNGETIHGLNDQVTSTLIVGDKKVILRKAINENWVTLHFNITTSWQDRRKIPLSVIGDISDEVVISNSMDLIKLKELLIATA